MLQINRPEKTKPSDNHRLIWCPYIPDEEDSGTTANTTSDSSLPDDVGKLLVLTHDEVVSTSYNYYPLFEILHLIFMSHSITITSSRSYSNGYVYFVHQIYSCKKVSSCIRGYCYKLVFHPHKKKQLKFAQIVLSIL